MNPPSPIFPGIQFRKLPDSIAAAGLGSSGDPLGASAPVPLVRSTVPAQWSPLGNMQPGTTGVVTQLAPANPNRTALILRVRGGDATTVIGLVAKDYSIIAGPGTDKRYVPILNGETLTLEMAGEVYVSHISGAAATIYLAELINVRSQ